MYSLRLEISVSDFVLISIKFVLSHRHLFPIGGSSIYELRIMFYDVRLHGSNIVLIFIDKCCMEECSRESSIYTHMWYYFIPPPSLKDIKDLSIFWCIYILNDVQYIRFWDTVLETEGVYAFKSYLSWINVVNIPYQKSRDMLHCFSWITAYNYIISKSYMQLSPTTWKFMRWINVMNTRISEITGCASIYVGNKFSQLNKCLVSIPDFWELP
jgi:hypothetical protein